MILWFWAAALTPTGVGGQQLGSVSPGSRVRVTSPALVTWTAEGLLTGNADGWVQLDTDEGAVSVAAATVTRLEASLGARRRTLRGAALGIVTGAIVVLVGGTDEVWDEGDPECPSAARCAWILGSGLAAGGLVGYLWRTEEWEDRPVTGIAVSLGPAWPGRTELKISLPW